MVIEVVAYGICCMRTTMECIRCRTYLWYDAKRKVAVCPDCWHLIVDGINRETR